MTPFQVMLCTVRSDGNCGNGDAGTMIESRYLGWDMMHAPEKGKVVFYEVAWHHGKTASATGYHAARRRRAAGSTQQRPSQ